MGCPNACYKRQDRRTWQKQGEYANMGSAPQPVTGHIKTAVLMQKLTIYHNPRCSKSRQALEIIRQHGIEPDVIFYLQEPLQPSSLRNILDRLGLPAKDILRKSENEFKTHFKDIDLNNETEVITYMVQFPKVIERPIILSETAAVIGRPPENVLNLITA